MWNTFLNKFINQKVSNLFSEDLTNLNVKPDTKLVTVDIDNPSAFEKTKTKNTVVVVPAQLINIVLGTLVERSPDDSRFKETYDSFRLAISDSSGKIHKGTVCYLRDFEQPDTFGELFLELINKFNSEDMMRISFFIRYTNSNLCYKPIYSQHELDNVVVMTWWCYYKDEVYGKMIHSQINKQSNIDTKQQMIKQILSKYCEAYSSSLFENQNSDNKPKLFDNNFFKASFEFAKNYDKDDNKNLKCIVCCDKELVCRAVKCNHVCVCEQCAKFLRSCPICRAPTTWEKVYIVTD